VGIFVGEGFGKHDISVLLDQGGGFFEDFG
jgi:hypothetical protein